MWSWTNQAPGQKPYRSQTVSPATTNRIDYHPTYSPPPKPLTEQEKQLQRAGTTGIPLGYYTTRQIIPPSRSPIRFPLPQQASNNTNYFYGYEQAMQNGYGTYPEAQRFYSPQKTQGSSNNKNYSKKTDAYSVSNGPKSVSAVSVLQQPKKQNKHAPVKKKIEKRTRQDSAGAISGTNSSLHNYKPRGVTSDDLQFPQTDEGFDNIFIDVGESILGDTSDTNLSDVETNHATTDKYHTVRSNKSIKSGNSSVRFSEKALHIEDYLGDSYSTDDSDKRTGSYQGSIPVHPAPDYASVIKHNRNLSNSVFELPDTGIKDEEPVYSTIGEKRTPSEELDETDNINTESVIENKKEPPPRRLSVLDELKIHFANKKSSKTKDSSGSNDVTNDVSQKRNEELDFQPMQIPPPVPPALPTMQTQPTTNSSALTPVFLMSAAPPPPPPPPNFIPPPPPSQDSQMSSNKLNIELEETQPTPQAVGKLEDESNINLEPQIRDNISGQTINNERSTNIANQDKTNEGNHTVIVIEQEKDNKILVFDNTRDYQPLIKEDTGVHSNMQQTEKSRFEDNAESSEDEEDDSDDEDGESDDDDPTRPKSILKNRDETPLVNPDTVLHLQSDSENEDETGDGNIVVKRDSMEVKSDEAELADNLIENEDNKGTGVSFTGETLDNEGTAKQYKKEGINLSDIYKGRISSKTAIAKPNPIYHEETDGESRSNTTSSSPQESQHHNVNQKGKSIAPNPPAPLLTMDKEPTSQNSEETTIDDTFPIYDKPRPIARSTLEPMQKDNQDSNKSKQKKSSNKLQKAPKSILKNKAKEVNMNGSVPGLPNLHSDASHSITSAASPKSPTPSGTLSNKSDMYYSLKRTPNNISVIKIQIDDNAEENEDGKPLADNFTLLRNEGYTTDTMTSKNSYNFSIDTGERTLSLGSAGDLNISPSPHTPVSLTTPRSNNFVFDYPSPNNNTADPPTLKKVSYIIFQIREK